MGLLQAYDTYNLPAALLGPTTTVRSGVDAMVQVSHLLCVLVQQFTSLGLYNVVLAALTVEWAAAENPRTRMTSGTVYAARVVTSPHLSLAK